MSLAFLRIHVLVDSLSAGGAEMLVAESARSAASVGIQMSAGHLWGAHEEGPAAALLRDAGVEPVAVPIPRRISSAAVAQVRRHLATQQFDLLHTHLGYADLLGLTAARSLGKPAVSTVHQMHWHGSRRDRIKYRLMALARRRCADRVVAVSDAARAAYLATGWDRPERVSVVRNGFDREPATGEGPRIREELGLDPDHFVAVIIATFRPEKGHDVAFEAARRLSGQFPQFRLLVVGYAEPDREAEVRAAAERAGPAVVMAGHRSDVMEILDAADVLVQPSHADAYPTALLEAMAAGTPVVASRVGGVPEIAGPPGAVALIDAPPDPAELAAELAGLISDPSRRRSLGEAGRRRYLSAHTSERWATEIRRVYDEVLALRR